MGLYSRTAAVSLDLPDDFHFDPACRHRNAGSGIAFPPDAPKVSFISPFAEGRSDEEIRQSNLENQKRKDAREAELAELRQQKVDAYKTLGRATGLDVDEMARQAAIENAREAAEAEARRRALYRAGSTVDDSGE